MARDKQSSTTLVQVTYRGDKRWDNSTGLTIGRYTFVTGVPQLLPAEEAEALQRQLAENDAYQHYRFSFAPVDAAQEG